MYNCVPGKDAVWQRSGILKMKPIEGRAHLHAPSWKTTQNHISSAFSRIISIKFSRCWNNHSIIHTCTCQKIFMLSFWKLSLIFYFSFSNGTRNIPQLSTMVGIDSYKTSLYSHVSIGHIFFLQNVSLLKLLVYLLQHV